MIDLNSPLVILDSANRKRNESGFADVHLFADCVRTEFLYKLDDANDFLDEIEAYSQNVFVVCWLSYELGQFFDVGEYHSNRSATPAPFAWFGAFRTPIPFSSADFSRLIEFRQKQEIRQIRFEDFPSLEKYEVAVNKIKRFILAGEIYQANYTFPLEGMIYGDPLATFHRLREQQPVHFGAYINDGKNLIFSRSPEQFFRVEADDSQIDMRPMKGTVKRRRKPNEDQQMIDWLRSDSKNLAENLMITDLIRNDLSRICEPGSVHVCNLFEIETYKTVHQMTSAVTGSIKGSKNLKDILSAVFPCGSVTGAPKIQATKAIKSVENEERGIYTGAIGVLTPANEKIFSVSIRTMISDKRGRFKLNIGSGIVADSDPKAEFNECLLKAEFVRANTHKEYALIETMQLTANEGIKHLALHLNRMERSSNELNFQFDRQRIMSALESIVEPIVNTESMRSLIVRLLIDHFGNFSIATKPLSEDSLDCAQYAVVSNLTIDSKDLMRQHKTTLRRQFEADLLRQQNRNRDVNIYDTIYKNEIGNFAEGSYNTLYIEMEKGPLITPPLAAGVLPGILRQALIDSGEAITAEISEEMLHNAKQVWLGNSVRGLVRVNVLPG